MHILVAYASKHGGTEGLAQAIANRLSEAGHAVTVATARSVEDLDGYDAVVLGGALYAGRWPWQAVRFIQRFLDELEDLPVWFFSSGPLDTSASLTRIAPTRQVAHWLGRVRAQGHVTFGGRLDPNEPGFVASAMVKNGRSGDFRDWQQVRDWAESIVDQLEVQGAPVRDRERVRSLRVLRNRIIGLTALSGIFALVGGLELVTLPENGPLIALTRRTLQHTPFPSFFWPGLILAASVGLSNLVSALSLSLRMRHGAIIAAVSGVVLSAFAIAEGIALRTVSAFELCFFAAGVAVTAFALQLRHLEAKRAPTPDKPASTRAPDLGAQAHETA